MLVGEGEDVAVPLAATALPPAQLVDRHLPGVEDGQLPTSLTDQRATLHLEDRLGQLLLQQQVLRPALPPGPVLRLVDLDQARHGDHHHLHVQVLPLPRQAVHHQAGHVILPLSAPSPPVTAPEERHGQPSVRHLQDLSQCCSRY